MAGVENLKKCVMAGAELLNVLSKIAHKQGVFVAFQLVDELSALSGLDGAVLKQELVDLSPEERAELISALKEKLVLLNPAVEAKIEASADLLNEAADVVVSAVALVNKAKLILA